MFCEMVKMEALLQYDENTFRMLHYNASMRPIGAQLCGSNPKLAAPAARIIEDMGFDAVDLNCGCPVDNVTKDGSGSALLRSPLRIGEILSNMVSAVSIPVTVKIRVGWDEENLVHQDLVRIAELAGAKALTIHGRTRKQAYLGKANWEWIKEAKQAAKTIGNGDVFSVEDAVRMLETTTCDGVLIARGLFGKPWLANDICHYAKRGEIPIHSAAERREILINHFHETLSHCSDQRVLIDMRRVGCWYIGRSKGARGFREALIHVTTVEEMRELIYQLPLQEDGK
jgi:nifR3 family TIM-barrel protein